MSTREKTVSFRATSDFWARTAAAWEFVRSEDLSESGSSSLGRTFELCLLRIADTLPAEPPQSELVRAAMEAWLTAVEKVRRERELEAQYAAWAAGDSEGDEFRRAAAAAAGTVWEE